MALDLNSADPSIISKAKTRALLPAGYGGCTQQFSLQFQADGTPELSNRGPGVVSALGAPATQMSLPDFAGKAALACNLGTNAGGVQARMDAPPAELQTLGEMTVLLRVACAPYWAFGANPGFCVSMGDYAAAPPAGNHAWSLLVNHNGGGPATLRYYASAGAGRTTILFDSAAMPATPRSDWCVISLRRNAAGTVVRLGLNSTFESSGTLTAPTGATQAKLGFGDSYGSNANAFIGMLADFNFAPVSMTDAQVTAAVAIMLGT